MLSRIASMMLAIGALITFAAQAQDLSKYPDWSGQWKKPPGVGNNFDWSKGAGAGQQAPLTAKSRAIFETFAAVRAEGGLGGDPTGLCLPHGMPRMMIAVFPIELIVMPATIYVLTDYTTHRRIFTDGRSCGRTRSCRASTAIPSADGRIPMAMVSTTCSRLKRAASKARARSRAAGCRCTRMA